jgi:hypothetical protein
VTTREALMVIAVSRHARAVALEELPAGPMDEVMIVVGASATDRAAAQLRETLEVKVEHVLPLLAAEFGLDLEVAE